MTEKQLDRKVSVFISSKCDNDAEVKQGMLKYGIIRKSLTLLLEETNMCKVYVFEKGTGTSYDVVHSYMDYLDDCDIVIVLVDDKDGVTPATQEEINRAKALHKKAYIFFVVNMKIKQRSYKNNYNLIRPIQGFLLHMSFQIYRKLHIKQLLMIYFNYI